MSRGRAANGNGLQPRKRSDGRWEARFKVGTNPGTGKPVYKTIYAQTADECARKLRAATAAVDEHTYTEPSKMPLKEWLEIWQNEYLGSVKDTTGDVYKTAIRRHIVPALGAVKLCELRPHDCQTFINDLYRGKNGREKLGSKSCRNVHGTLHKALQVAVKIGYIASNPASNVELPRKEQKEIHPLEGDQISAFLAAIEDSPSRPVFFIALFTGTRLSELLGLQWRYVDFKAGTVKICQQLLWKRSTGKERTLGDTKNSKSRIIKPPQAVMDMLAAVKRQQAQWQLLAGPVWNNALGLVFTDETGNPLPHTTIEHRFKQIVKKIGLPERRFHDLRHTYATESIRLGIPIKVISETLGHYSVGFTLDVYGHTTAEMQDDAAARMQDAITKRMTH